eukprot:1565127-Alexandrium_andersonii.AAC.1
MSASLVGSEMCIRDRASPSAKIEGNAERLAAWYATDRSSRWPAARPRAPRALPGTHSASGATLSKLTMW